MALLDQYAGEASGDLNSCRRKIAGKGGEVAGRGNSIYPVPPALVQLPRTPLRLAVRRARSPADCDSPLLAPSKNVPTTVMAEARCRALREEAVR